MRIISKKRLREFWERHAGAKEPLLAWYRLTKKASWKSLAETRADFPHADLYLCCTIFNVKGNHYRLISKIYYERQTVLVRYVLTHPEYDKEGWKSDCES